MKLQRYIVYVNTGELETKPDDKGKMIYHSEALDWFDSLLDRPITDHFDWSERETVTTERDRLRALIAAERGNG